MASPALVLKGIQFSYRVLSKGTLKAKILGTLIGLALVAPIAYVAWIEFVPLLLVFGAYCGAMIASAIFQKPHFGYNSLTTEVEPIQFGKVLKSWTYTNDTFQSIIVLLESAVYVAHDDHANWPDVLNKLSRGDYSDLRLGEMLRLNDLLQIEMSSHDALEFDFVHSPMGRFKRYFTNIQTREDRDELFEALEQQLHRPFVMSERPVKRSQAILNPVALLIFVDTIFALATWLAVYWTANPPPPPSGKTEQAPLAQLMIWAGPVGVLAVGAVVTIPVLYWLVRSYVSPPQIVVIPLREDNVVVNN